MGPMSPPAAAADGIPPRSHALIVLAAVALGAPELARNVLQTVEDRAGGFRSVTRGSLPKNPLVRLLDGVCGLFSPLL